MVDLVIFTQYSKAYAPRRLAVEAKNMDLRFKIYEYSKIKNVAKLPISKYVILREPDADKNLYVLRDKILKSYVEKGSVILNKNSYLKWSILDKKTQTIEFEIASIPHVNLLKLSEVKYPFIAKSKLGSHGSHVFKIEGPKDLDNVLKNYNIEDLLFQEFQTSGFDLRVIVLGGRVLGIMKRTPREGEFLSNFSQGGTVNKFSKDNKTIKTIERIAIKAAKHFKLDYVGVDLMMGNPPDGPLRREASEAGDGEWKVLEVNRACQFKGFERALGTNVALSILNYLIN